MIVVLAVYAFLMWLILWTATPEITQTHIDLKYHGADMITEGWRGELVAYRFDRAKGVYKMMWRRKGNL
jgi:hypothetical protein